MHERRLIAWTVNVLIQLGWFVAVALVVLVAVLVYAVGALGRYLLR